MSTSRSAEHELRLLRLEERADYQRRVDDLAARMNMNHPRRTSREYREAAQQRHSGPQRMTRSTPPIGRSNNPVPGGYVIT